MEAKGFLGSLFDLSFKEFVTPKVLKILFILAIIGAAIAAIGMIIGGLALLKYATLKGLFMIIASPVVFVVYTLLARIWLELVIVIFRISENIDIIAKK